MTEAEFDALFLRAIRSIRDDCPEPPTVNEVFLRMCSLDKRASEAMATADMHFACRRAIAYALVTAKYDAAVMADRLTIVEKQ